MSVSPRFQYDFSSSTGLFKGKVDIPSGVFIDNEYVDSVDGGRIDIFNPATGKVIGAIAAANEKDVDIAVKSARKAFNTTWGLNYPGLQRGKLLMKLADLLEANLPEFAALEALDVGKPVGLAEKFDVQGAIDTFRYYAGFAGKVDGKTLEVGPKKFAYTRLEPVGVVGAIVPWNFPLLLSSQKIAPALATGCSVVFKASEVTPLTGLRLASLIKEAGFPAGAFNVVTGYGATAGNAITLHMDVDKVSFTGSTLVGRTVMKNAASSNLKKVALELGGKSPSVVLDDADLQHAANWVTFGLRMNAGQACTANTRVYVQDTVYDKFVDLFVKRMEAVKIGDPLAEGTFHGPQVSQTQFERIMSYIELGKQEGATIALGGERWGTEGYFIKPTIFTNVTEDMRIVKEEIFGPVVTIHKFKTDEEAIELANDTQYGLAAGLFSTNTNRTINFVNAYRAGTIWVNQYNIPERNVPFGGYKQSGLGRENSEYTLHEFCEIKGVHIQLDLAPPPEM